MAQSSNMQRAAYQTVPLGSIKPNGWLKNQLHIMRAGTTGHLDEVYGRLKNDNGWLGGKGDGWEETPYWLDGAVPLAYLLEDKILKDKVLKYIHWTLENQRPSGYFGAITEEERKTGIKISEANCEGGDDWWPKMIMLKVLQQYYTASKDARVIPFMTKYFHYQIRALKKCPLGKWTEWAQSRGIENVMLAQWVFEQTKDSSLIELAELIEAQSFPWSTWMGNRDWVMGAAAQQNEYHWMHRHAVNVGMALKAPAINYQRTKDSAYLKALKTGFKDLMSLHGLPMGIFSGDEDLHGNDPTQGTELCTIVEAMFSLENIVAITGDMFYMDALERMTFNALPTQTTDDYNAKQYYQIPNQVQVQRGVFNFSLPLDNWNTNVFGMESGYTCCLANMHQGWTKFAQQLWYTTPDNGIAALTYSANTFTTKIGSSQTDIKVNEVTDYPFGDKVRFEFTSKKPVTFPFHLRIPAWCNEAVISLNGKELQREKGGQVIIINRTWNNTDKLELHLPMQVYTSNWGRNSRSVEYGPLVYALKLEENWVKGTDEKQGDYYNVFPKGPWNYGLMEKVIKNPLAEIEVKQVKPVSDRFIWNMAHAPIEIQVSARKIPSWKISGDVATQPVTDRFGLFRGEVAPDEEKITLIPYGCSKLRIVAFPVVK